jgi:hypothetical protein
MALQQYDASARALERSRNSYAHAGTEEAEYRLLANVTRQNLIATMRRRLAELEALSAPVRGARRGAVDEHGGAGPSGSRSGRYRPSASPVR